MTTNLDPLYLQSLTDNELADLHHKNGATSPFLVLIEQEWRRRIRLDQHRLSEQLLDKQIEFNKYISFSQDSLATSIHNKQAKLAREIHKKQTRTTIAIACIAGISTILAALLGAGFGFYLSTTNSPKISLSEPKMETTISATKSSKIQKANALTNVSSPNPTLNQTTNRGVESGKVIKKERSR